MYWIYEGVYERSFSIPFYFAIYLWLLFILRYSCAMFYRNYIVDFTASHAVVMPVFNEDPAKFSASLKTILAQSQDVTVVVNGEWPEKAAVIDLSEVSGARVIVRESADKREAIVAGALSTDAEILILADSDVLAAQNAIAELLKPFADKRIGGVAAYQRALRGDEPLMLYVISDWIENMRFLLNQRAQSAFCSVGCLPGRLIALRRELIINNASGLMNQTFLGQRCNSGDDRYLTSCCLKAGYGTVVQSSSVALTRCQATFPKFLAQQLRWARSSQRETLTSLNWLWNYPIVFIIFISDIITPIFFLLVIVYIISSFSADNYNLSVFGILIFIVTWIIFSMISVGLRHSPHLLRDREACRYAIVMIIIFMPVLCFIRIFALLTMNDQRWRTR